MRGGLSRVGGRQTATGKKTRGGALQSAPRGGGISQGGFSTIKKKKEQEIQEGEKKHLVFQSTREVWEKKKKNEKLTGEGAKKGERKMGIRSSRKG